MVIENMEKDKVLVEYRCDLNHVIFFPFYPNVPEYGYFSQFKDATSKFTGFCDVCDSRVDMHRVGLQPTGASPAGH